MEGNVLARPTFCGKATTSLQRLAQPFVPLLEGQTPAPIVGTSTGPAARLVTGRRAQWRRVLSGGEWWSGVTRKSEVVSRAFPFCEKRLAFRLMCQRLAND